MKPIISLLFVIFLFNSCNPLSLDEDERRKRDFKTDPAKGKTNYTPEDLKEISAEELLKKAFKEDCSKYKNVTSFSIFGDKLPIKALQNCLAKALDESTKEICIEEAKAKELKRHYEKRGEDQGVREMEEHLAEIEDIKYEVTEDIYSMADEVYDQCEELRDEIDAEMEEKANTVFEKFLGRSGKFLVTSECQGFRRILDSRGRNPCRSLSLSKIRQ